MSLEGMVTQAEKSLGLREPNHIQDWYADRNGSAFAYNFAWCDASITYWAAQAGEHEAVCFGTDYAYTVWHADRFRKAGRWHTDVAGIRRGDIVFIDWGGSNTIGRIDHVGIVTGVSGARVFTIEGNTANVCARRVRSAKEIVGYGRPAYKAATKKPPAAGGDTYTVRKGDTLSEIAAAHGTTVKALADLNKLADPDKIRAGQKLKIPGKTAPAPAPARPVVDLSRLVAAARSDPPRAGTPISYYGVKTVETALVAEQLLQRRYADGHFGTATVSAYAAWQRRCGYTGRDADGVPGKDSLTRLGKAHGFTVKD